MDPQNSFWISWSQWRCSVGWPELPNAGGYCRQPAQGGGLDRPSDSPRLVFGNKEAWKGSSSCCVAAIRKKRCS